MKFSLLISLQKRFRCPRESEARMFVVIFPIAGLLLTYRWVSKQADEAILTHGYSLDRQRIEILGFPPPQTPVVNLTAGCSPLEINASNNLQTTSGGG